jgi:AraC-like DNA-binding protein
MNKKVSALFQKLPLSKGNSFLINRYQSPFFETPWHFHEEYELVYCEKGFGKKFIGNSFSDYQEGEMAFIGKNVPHLFKADDSFYNSISEIKPSSIVLQFSDTFIGNGFFQSAEMTEMKKILEFSKNGIVITGETKQKIKAILYDMLKTDSISKLKNLIEIFGLLSTSHDLKPLSIDTIRGINVNDSSKMNMVLEYALEHYKDEITIKEMADLVHISVSAFCRYFKSRTQKSFHSFIIEMRLMESVQLLKSTDMPVLNICYDSGFNNLSNFNRLFKRHFGQSPTKFRRSFE